MKATAVILARAGSKGVPGKNTRMIAGRPCAAWTLDAAQQAAHVGHVAVTTDDAHIATMAELAGATAIARPADLADDSASVDAAARHAIDDLEMIGHRVKGDPIVILYANVPIRPAGLIDRAVELLTTSGCDSVQSYAPVGKHHPWWTARLDDDVVRPWEGDVLNHGVYRRQELPPAYVPDAGVIALTRRALFCENRAIPPGPHAFFGIDRRGIRTEVGEVVDIDSEIDLLVADAILTRAMAAQH